jgi:hypothetical protein
LKKTMEEEKEKSNSLAGKGNEASTILLMLSSILVAATNTITYKVSLFSNSLHSFSHDCTHCTHSITIIT